MIHPDQTYQLRQLRNQELAIESQRARNSEELVRNQSLLEYGKSGTARMKLILRYVLATLATIVFGIQLN
jgi:hypothetical protein